MNTSVMTKDAGDFIFQMRPTLSVHVCVCSFYVAHYYYYIYSL
jgi:hypothetical protein